MDITRVCHCNTDQLSHDYTFVFFDIYFRLIIEAVEERVGKMNILPVLTSNMSEFATRMHTYVYPTIADNDHDSLTFYYKLLCGCEGMPINGGLSPDAHVKLLKKIKPVAEGTTLF